MAVTLAAQAQLSRPGTFFDPTQDWTWFQQVRYGATTPAGAFFRLYLAYGDPASAHAYIALRSPAASNTIVLKTFDGTTTTTSAAYVPAASTWVWIGATYTAATHTLTFYGNSATPIGTISVNLSTFVFTETTSAIGSTVAGTSFGDFSVGYVRQWQVVLTGTQLVAEALSVTPVQMGTLLTDTPVQASIDLTAHNNTLTQWTATGTVTTNTTDALVTVVAGPPTNTSPATATAVTIDSVYFQDVNTAGVATTVWHKYTATDDYTYGFDYLGDLTTYKPQIFIYEGLANANSGTTYLDFGNAIQQNLPIQFPVTSGNTYYFKALRNGAVAASTLQVSLLRALELTVPIGSIAVSDDIQNYASAFLDLDTGYPIFFKRLPIFGEGGSILSDGTLMLSESIASDKPIIFDADLNVVAEVDLAAYDNISANPTNTFLLGETGQNPAVLRLVSATGTVDPTLFDLGAFGVNSIGLNVDASKAYYTLATSTNTPIKVWNLLTNAADTDLVAGVANYYSIAQDILILGNGDILAGRNKPSVTRNYLITNYSAAGVVQHTYDFGLDQDQNNRVFRAIDDPNSFWTWIKLKTAAGLTRTGFSRFVNVKTSDGTYLHDLNGIIEYESGIYAGITATVTPVRFGHAESCPAWIVRTGTTPTPTQTFEIRRQRRFLLPSSDDNKRMTIPTLELLMRTGIGLSKAATTDPPIQGQNPQVMLRISKDGGKTWGPERWRSAGEIGNFVQRVRWLQATGQYRNAVCEITVTDPVDWQFLAMMGDPEEGAS